MRTHATPWPVRTSARSPCECTRGAHLGDCTLEVAAHHQQLVKLVHACLTHSGAITRRPRATVQRQALAAHENLLALRLADLDLELGVLCDIRGEGGRYCRDHARTSFVCLS
jgi:hypothetical protein